MIIITGIGTMIDNTLFQIVYFDIEYNGKVYHWKDYSPLLSNEELFNYINNKSIDYETIIAQKEAEFATNPTKEVLSLGGELIIVPKTYEEVVKPELEKKGNYCV